MSTDVVNPLQLMNNFANILSTRDRYGEVFIDQQRAVVLHCSLCNVQYRAYKEFLEHIFTHYYAKKRNSREALEQLSTQEIKQETADIDLEEQQISQEALEKADNLLVEALAENEEFQIDKETTGIALEEQQISQEALEKADNILVEALAENEEYQIDKETTEDNPLAEQNIPDMQSDRSKPNRKLRNRQKTLQQCQVKAKTRTLNSQHEVEVKCEASNSPVADHFEATSADLVATLNSVDSTATWCSPIRYTTPPVIGESIDDGNTKPKLKTSNSGNDEQTLACKICGCNFKCVSSLRAHTIRHTGQKPFACGQCRMEFYTRTELGLHEQRRHTEHRPFVCAYCGVGCVSKSTLSLHERKHSANLPHVCNVCGKAFAHAFRLRNHMPVHTRERNHVCSVCSAAFTHRKVLGVHMKLHLNAREYKCDLCSMSFNQRPSMLLHKKSKHNVIINNRAKSKVD